MNHHWESLGWTLVHFCWQAAAIALVYPPLAGVAFSDFHENGFVPAATLWLLWAVDARRWRLACAFLAVTLAIKEDQAPILVFGAIVALAPGRDHTVDQSDPCRLLG